MVTVSFPQGRNPITGKKEYTDAQLKKLKPIWRDQWETYSYFDSEMVGFLVNKLHCGIFSWPGNRIIEGQTLGMDRWLKRTAREWQDEDRSFTGSQLAKEAARRMNEEVRYWAAAYNIEDPFGAEYYLTKGERKLHRSSARSHRRDSSHYGK